MHLEEVQYWLTEDLQTKIASVYRNNAIRRTTRDTVGGSYFTKAEISEMLFTAVDFTADGFVDDKELYQAFYKFGTDVGAESLSDLA